MQRRCLPVLVTELDSLEVPATPLIRTISAAETVSVRVLVSAPSPGMYTSAALLPLSVSFPAEPVRVSAPRPVVRLAEVVTAAAVIAIVSESVLRPDELNVKVDPAPMDGSTSFLATEHFVTHTHRAPLRA